MARLAVYQKSSRGDWMQVIFLTRPHDLKAAKQLGYTVRRHKNLPCLGIVVNQFRSEDERRTANALINQRSQELESTSKRRALPDQEDEWIFPRSRRKHRVH